MLGGLPSPRPSKNKTTSEGFSVLARTVSDCAVQCWAQIGKGDPFELSNQVFRMRLLSMF